MERAVVLHLRARRAERPARGDGVFARKRLAPETVDRMREAATDRQPHIGSNQRNRLGEGPRAVTARFEPRRVLDGLWIRPGANAMDPASGNLSRTGPDL